MEYGDNTIIDPAWEGDTLTDPSWDRPTNGTWPVPLYSLEALKVLDGLVARGAPTGELVDWWEADTVVDPLKETGHEPTSDQDPTLVWLPFRSLPLPERVRRTGSVGGPKRHRRGG